MNLQQIADRIARLERATPDLTPGPHRLTDGELSDLIAAIRQAEAGEPIEPARDEWAAAVLHREGMLRCPCKRSRTGSPGWSATPRTVGSPA